MGISPERVVYADFKQISMFHPPDYHTPVAPFRDSVPFPPLCLVAGTEGGFHGDRFPIPHELQGRRSKLCYKSTSSSFVQDLLIVLSPFVKLH